MNVDKYLEKVTSRLSFNYFAFQATTLFVTFVTSYIATFQYAWFFHKDVEALDLLFHACILLLIPVVLAVTFLEFIFFSVRKKLSQKLFSKSLIIIHILFTYLFYSVLMFPCPDKDTVLSMGYLFFIFSIIVLYPAITIFTIIPVVLLFIIETVGKLKLNPMQYMKNIWAFWFVIITSCIFITIIIFSFRFLQEL